MKPHHLLLLFPFSLMTSCMSPVCPDFLRIHPGMSKDEVFQLFGAPTYCEFDEQTSSWEYVYGRSLNERKHAMVYFENGKVVRFRNFAEPLPPPASPLAEYPQPRMPRPYRFRLHLGNTERAQRFSELLNAVKKESFSDERLRILKSAVKEMTFSAAEVAEILKTENFDSDRIKLLRFLAPSIVDYRQSHEILSAFTFSTSREEAESILENSRER
ncbi:DUF4476 domain-containing protein [Alloprevotella sp. OH1205_COT-284]|uniref:DUF4476 domain-containing protein n=1 Tax=Alloprevotella sp. OH1205_COT-284 TaxID=2491043 RepID=UPI000F5F2446|nr:DUF4476 domain-containing protein [Alloprevotella sp. OH1205_COT-284]RRD78404.1 DUF4476 domain-containing protein [Alloprevotella sp. OH1205_COT-284]